MAHKSDAEFAAENDMRTLVESKRIMKDPKRKKAAMAQARKEKAALETISKGK